VISSLSWATSVVSFNVIVAWIRMLPFSVLNVVLVKLFIDVVSVRIHSTVSFNNVLLKCEKFADCILIP